MDNTDRDLKKKQLTAIADTAKWSDRLVGQLESGEIKFLEFQRAIALRVRDLKISSLELAKRGKENTYAIDYLAQARQLKNIDYPAMAKLFLEISEGKHSVQMVKARLRGFWLSSRQAFEQGIQSMAEKKGFTHMKRILAIADHCPECVEYANRGVKPIGDLPLPTESCTCKFNCKCSVLYGRLEDFLSN